jgi:hypothetical protein
MRSKLSTFVLASTAMAAAALATIPAVAATSTTLNVPFSFMVEGQTLPAGHYSIVRDGARNFLTLKGQNLSKTYTWIASPLGGGARDSVTLKFDSESQGHVLQSIQYGPLVTPRLDRKKGAEDVPQQPAPGQ